MVSARLENLHLGTCIGNEIESIKVDQTAFPLNSLLDSGMMLSRMRQPPSYPVLPCEDVRGVSEAREVMKSWVAPSFYLGWCTNEILFGGVASLLGRAE